MVFHFSIFNSAPKHNMFYILYTSENKIHNLAVVKLYTKVENNRLYEINLNKD